MQPSQRDAVARRGVAVDGGIAAPAPRAPNDGPDWAAWPGLLEASADMLLVIRGGVVLWISAAVESVLGWTPAEVAGQPFTRFRHPDDAAPSADELPVLGGPSRTMPRARYRCRDGGYRWVQSRMTVRIAPDGLEVLVASVRGVDDQVATEDELGQAHARLQAAMDASPDGLACYEVRRDAVGAAAGFVLESWNASAAASYGGPVRPATGMDFDELVPDGDRNGLRGLLLRAADHRTLQRLRTVLDRPGLRRTLDLVAVPVGNTHVLVTWRDVTEQAMSEQLVVEAYTRAQAVWDTLHIALDSVPEPVLIVETDPAAEFDAGTGAGNPDQPLRLVFVNVAAVGDRQVDRDDLLGRDFAQVYPNHADELRDAIAAIRSDGRPRLVVMTSRPTATGRVDYYETSISPAPPSRYVIIGRNVTPHEPDEAAGPASAS